MGTVLVSGKSVPKPRKYDRIEDRKNIELAYRLDRGICQWCYFTYGIVKKAGPPHHTYRKRRRWDIDAIISLCIECHEKVHKAIQRDGVTEITKDKLVALMEEKVIPARRLRVEQTET